MTAVGGNHTQDCTIFAIFDHYCHYDCCKISGTVRGMIMGCRHIIDDEGAAYCAGTGT